MPTAGLGIVAAQLSVRWVLFEVWNETYWLRGSFPIAHGHRRDQARFRAGPRVRESRERL